MLRRYISTQRSTTTKLLIVIEFHLALLI